MPSPYPFRYPTPSERRARVKRHRKIALHSGFMGLVLVVFFMAAGFDTAGASAGALAGVALGIGIGIAFAHSEED